MHDTALVDEGTAALASSIGGLVRKQRNARSWTLDQLAEAAGVSRRMLVSVEQGAVNPSVGTLLRVSEALRVPLTSLLELPAPAAVTVTRAGEGTVLWTGQHGGSGVLVSSTPAGVAELWDWTLMPGERHDSVPHAAGTWELLQVQDGQLQLEADQQIETLGPGDAIAFAGDTGHAYANPGTTATRFSLAVIEPIAGTTQKGRSHA